MRKSKKLLTRVLVIAILNSLLVLMGCGTQEEKQNVKTSSEDNSIKETKLKDYEINVKTPYVYQTSVAGFALKFELKLKGMSPSYEAYVCDEKSSLFSQKVSEENNKRLEDLKKEKPDITEEEIMGDSYSLWYQSVFKDNVEYKADEKVEIEWVPLSVENNIETSSLEEEFVKKGNMYLILKEDKNIIGFMVFEIPLSNSGDINSVTYDKVNVLEAILFEKTDGKYQNISLDYVKNKVDEILKNTK